MKFRPCIDIHNGKVKQIVGGSLKDENDVADENFVATQDASYYAKLYREKGISGGHVILLNGTDSPYYDATKEQALMALEEYKGGLQIGGGINDKNALFYLNSGASHVIVTSYVFSKGQVNYDNLKKINRIVGKDHLVLDVSCRKKGDKYYIVTDRWQNFTEVELSEETFYELYQYCDEFLIHAVDVEGKAKGIEQEVAIMLGKLDGMKLTYAGGIGSFSDLNNLKQLGKNKVDFTVGSALDIFGGNMKFEEVVNYK